MKRNAFAWWEFVAVLAVLAVATALLWPAFTRARDSDEGRDFCVDNLHLIGIGMQQYAQDVGGQLPPTHWSDGVRLYTRGAETYQCPFDSAGEAANTTDYFFNSRLASLNPQQITNPASAILVGDGEGNQPANYTLAQLPISWIYDATSPARRHLEGAQYLFVDGHLKWLKPKKITLDKPTSGKPTFEVKP